MTRTLKTTALALSILVGATSLITPSAFAEPKPIHEPTYRFELVEQTLHAGKGVPVHIKLVALADVKTGTKSTPVTNATFDPPKLVMLMPGMAPMPGHASKAASDSDGTYGFAADLVAAGDWTLELTAHVPNKEEAIHNTLELVVEK